MWDVPSLLGRSREREKKKEQSYISFVYIDFRKLKSSFASMHTFFCVRCLPL